MEEWDPKEMLGYIANNRQLHVTASALNVSKATVVDPLKYLTQSSQNIAELESADTIHDFGGKLRITEFVKDTIDTTGRKMYKRGVHQLYDKRPQKLLYRELGAQQAHVERVALLDDVHSPETIAIDMSLLRNQDLINARAPIRFTGEPFDRIMEGRKIDVHREDDGVARNGVTVQAEYVLDDGNLDQKLRRAYFGTDDTMSFGKLYIMNDSGWSMDKSQLPVLITPEDKKDPHSAASKGRHICSPLKCSSIVDAVLTDQSATISVDGTPIFEKEFGLIKHRAKELFRGTYYLYTYGMFIASDMESFYTDMLHNEAYKPPSDMEQVCLYVSSKRLLNEKERTCLQLAIHLVLREKGSWPHILDALNIGVLRPSYNWVWQSIYNDPSDGAMSDPWLNNTINFMVYGASSYFSISQIAVEMAASFQRLSGKGPSKKGKHLVNDKLGNVGSLMPELFEQIARHYANLAVNFQNDLRDIFITMCAHIFKAKGDRDQLLRAEEMSLLRNVLVKCVEAPQTHAMVVQRMLKRAHNVYMLLHSDFYSPHESISANMDKYISYNIFGLFTRELMVMLSMELPQINLDPSTLTQYAALCNKILYHLPHIMLVTVDRLLFTQNIVDNLACKYLEDNEMLLGGIKGPSTSCAYRVIVGDSKYFVVSKPSTTAFPPLSPQAVYESCIQQIKTNLLAINDGQYFQSMYNPQAGGMPPKRQRINVSGPDRVKRPKPTPIKKKNMVDELKTQLDELGPLINSIQDFVDKKVHDIQASFDKMKDEVIKIVREHVRYDDALFKDIKELDYVLSQSLLSNRVTPASKTEMLKAIKQFQSLHIDMGFECNGDKYTRAQFTKLHKDISILARACECMQTWITPPDKKKGAKTQKPPPPIDVNAFVIIIAYVAKQLLSKKMRVKYVDEVTFDFAKAPKYVDYLQTIIEHRNMLLASLIKSIDDKNLSIHFDIKQAIGLTKDEEVVLKQLELIGNWSTPRITKTGLFVINTLMSSIRNKAEDALRNHIELYKSLRLFYQGLAENFEAPKKERVLARHEDTTKLRGDMKSLDEALKVFYLYDNRHYLSALNNILKKEQVHITDERDHEIDHFEDAHEEAMNKRHVKAAGGAVPPLDPRQNVYLEYNLPFNPDLNPNIQLGGDRTVQIVNNTMRNLFALSIPLDALSPTQPDKHTCSDDMQSTFGSPSDGTLDLDDAPKSNEAIAMDERTHEASEEDKLEDGNDPQEEPVAMEQKDEEDEQGPEVGSNEGISHNLFTQAFCYLYNDASTWAEPFKWIHEELFEEFSTPPTDHFHALQASFEALDCINKLMVRQKRASFTEGALVTMAKESHDKVLGYLLTTAIESSKYYQGSHYFDEVCSLDDDDLLYILTSMIPRSLQIENKELQRKVRAIILQATNRPSFYDKFKEWVDKLQARDLVRSGRMATDAQPERMATDAQPSIFDTVLTLRNITVAIQEIEGCFDKRSAKTSTLLKRISRVTSELPPHVNETVTMQIQKVKTILASLSEQLKNKQISVEASNNAIDNARANILSIKNAIVQELTTELEHLKKDTTKNAPPIVVEDPKNKKTTGIPSKIMDQMWNVAENYIGTWFQHL